MTGKIHALVFLGFATLAASVAGCGGGGGTTCEPPTILLTWSIDDGTTNFQCGDVGAGWVDVTAAGVVSEFPCEAYAGQTFDEPSGSYAVDVQLLTPSRGTVLSEANNVFAIPQCGSINIHNVAFLVN